MLLDFASYVLLVMIFYDFSLHFIELMGWQMFFVARRNIFSYYWPVPNNRKNYTIFWTAYWGIAFVLLLIYACN